MALEQGSNGLGGGDKNSKKFHAMTVKGIKSLGSKPVMVIGLRICRHAQGQYNESLCNEFRTIALCNFAYKIISTVLQRI